MPLPRTLLLSILLALGTAHSTYYSIEWWGVPEIQVQNYMTLCPGPHPVTGTDVVWESHLDSRFVISVGLGGGAISLDFTSVALPHRVEGLSSWQVDSLGIEAILFEANYLLRHHVTSGDTIGLDSIRVRMLAAAYADTGANTVEWTYSTDSIEVSRYISPTDCVDSIYGDTSTAVLPRYQGHSGLALVREPGALVLELPQSAGTLLLAWVAADGRVLSRMTASTSGGRVSLQAPAGAVVLRVDGSGLSRQWLRAYP